MGKRLAVFASSTVFHFPFSNYEIAMLTKDVIDLYVAELKIFNQKSDLACIIVPDLPNST